MVTMGLLNTPEGIGSSQCVGARGEDRASWSCSLPLLDSNLHQHPAVASFQQESFVFKIKEMKPYMGLTPVMPALRLQQEQRQFEATWAALARLPHKQTKVRAMGFEERAFHSLRGS